MFLDKTCGLKRWTLDFLSSISTPFRAFSRLKFSHWGVVAVVAALPLFPGVPSRGVWSAANGQTRKLMRARTTLSALLPTFLPKLSSARFRFVNDHVAAAAFVLAPNA